MESTFLIGWHATQASSRLCHVPGAQRLCYAGDPHRSADITAFWRCARVHRLVFVWLAIIQVEQRRLLHSTSTCAAVQLFSGHPRRGVDRCIQGLLALCSELVGGCHGGCCLAARSRVDIAAEIQLGKLLTTHRYSPRRSAESRRDGRRRGDTSTCRGERVARIRATPGPGRQRGVDWRPNSSVERGLSG